MITKINNTEKIVAQLKKEGKVHYHDSPEDFEKMIAMNKFMEEVRRDFIKKNHGSEISASQTFFTC